MKPALLPNAQAFHSLPAPKRSSDPSETPIFKEFPRVRAGLQFFSWHSVFRIFIWHFIWHIDANAILGNFQMADDPKADNKRPAPPYVSYANFKNMIGGFKEHVLPGRIDRSVLGNFSGIVGGQLLTALRFLGLIDASNHPQDSLRELVSAANTPKWATELKRVLHAAYTPLYELDLKAASPSQFSEKFIKTYPGEGSTSRKSMTFFLTAAKDAQIEVSPYIMQNKKPRSGPTKKRSSKNSDGKPAGSSSAKDGENRRIPDPPAQTTKALSQQVLDVLDMDKMSEDEVGAVWTLLKYLRKEGK
jgi:Family of unknown function (DUF5343)